MKFLSRKLPRAIKLAGVAVLLGVLGWFALPFAIPLPVTLTSAAPESALLLDRHGMRITHFPLADSTRGTPATYGDFPRDFIVCTLAAEDKRFFEHGGLDLLATARALADGVRQKRVTSGASTVTQQLVKITSPPADRHLGTKLREALLARRLEMTWTKQEILTAYLNRVDYGNLRIGASEASRFYFQKPLADLSLAECALLAGLPQAPSRLNPLKHPERAKVRRGTVLGRLAKFDGQDPQRIARAAAEPLGLRPLRESHPAPWLAAYFAKRPLGTGRSTLDLEIQRAVETIVAEEVARHREENLRHAAVVVIENGTGEVLALVSSADWNDPRGGQINGALAPRSPGSALKPFTYLLALERGHTPASILADIPSPFRTPQGLDLPGNFDRTYRGPVTLRSSLACSLNVPALRQLNVIGGPRPLHDLLVNLGIGTLGNDPELHGLGLTLGNAPTRLIELTNAYATLARGGRHLPALLFPESDLPDALPLFSESSAFLIADILADSRARAPAFQPGGPLDLPFPCAVKTGTSSDFRDNWCIGFTRDFTVGVWAGNFENQPMKNLSGIAGAGPIFNRTMLRVHQNRAPGWYERPGGLADVVIDVRNGKRLGPDLAAGNRHALREIVQAANSPAFASPVDFDESGRSLLDAHYAQWFSSEHNRRRGELALSENDSGTQALQVVSPVDGATFLLDPEIPSGSSRLRPVTNLPGTARWHSETLEIEPGQPEPTIHLKIGTHTLTATDPRNGSTRVITLHVRNL